MSTLNTIGLAIDLVGVSLLGADLIRVQIRLRKQSSERQTLIQSASDRYGDAVAELESSVSNFYYSSYNYDSEGMTPSYEGPSVDAVAKALSGTAASVRKVHEYATDLAQITVETLSEEQFDSEKSLRMSRVGLALVGLGFFLQIIAAIFYA